MHGQEPHFHKSTAAIPWVMIWAWGAFARLTHSTDTISKNLSGNLVDHGQNKSGFVYGGRGKRIPGSAFVPKKKIAASWKALLASVIVIESSCPQVNAQMFSLVAVRYQRKIVPFITRQLGVCFIGVLENCACCIVL